MLVAGCLADLTENRTKELKELFRRDGQLKVSRKIMIVGNGEIGKEGAAAIAAADFVIRFNECRSYAASPGRTDVVAVCNTGRPGKAMTRFRCLAEPSRRYRSF